MAKTGAFDLPQWEEHEEITLANPLPRDFYVAVSDTKTVKPVATLGQVAERYLELDFLDQRQEARALLEAWLPAFLAAAKPEAASPQPVAKPAVQVDAVAKLLGFAADEGVISGDSRGEYLCAVGYPELGKTELAIAGHIETTGNLDPLSVQIINALNAEEASIVDGAMRAVAGRKEQYPAGVLADLEFKKTLLEIGKYVAEPIPVTVANVLSQQIIESRHSALKQYLLHEEMSQVCAPVATEIAMRHGFFALLEANRFAPLNFRVGQAMQLLDLVETYDDVEQPQYVAAILEGLAIHYDHLEGEQKVALAYRLAYGYESKELSGQAAKWYLCAADAAHRIKDEANFVAELDARLSAARLFLNMRLYDRSARICHRVVKLFENTLQYSWSGWESALEAIIISTIAEGAALKEMPTLPSPNFVGQKPSIASMERLALKARKLMERAPAKKLDRAEYWSVYLDDRLAHLYEINGFTSKAERYRRYAEEGWKRIGH